MKQYEFEAVPRHAGRIEGIRATAKTAEIARAHIVNYYGSQFTIAELCCDVRPAHHVLGEIDCSSAGAEDFALDMIAKGYK